MASTKMSIDEQRALWCVCDTIENSHCNYCAEHIEVREFAQWRERAQVARLQLSLFGGEQ